MILDCDKDKEVFPPKLLLNFINVIFENFKLRFFYEIMFFLCQIKNGTF